MSEEIILIMVTVFVSGLVNGLVAWGVMTAKLEGLYDGVKESKSIARSAHARIDAMMHRGKR